MAYDLKRIKVLGYTTDFQSCDCCGKENLAGTVAILDLDHDVKLLHFGTTCAAKADKYDTYEAFNAAKKEINKAVNKDKTFKREAEAGACSQLRRHFKMDNNKSVIEQCSVSCYEDVYSQLLKARRAHTYCVIDFPDQWTGINRHKGYR